MAETARSIPDLRRDVLRRIDAKRDQLVELVRDLVALDVGSRRRGELDGRMGVPT